MVNQSQFIELVKSSNPEKKTLASICTRGPQNGFYRKGAEIDGTIPIVKMSQLFGFESMGDVCHFDLVSMTEDELKRFSLTENDLLFGRRSLVPEGAGKCRRAGKVEQTVVFESSILRVSIDPDICYPRFIQAWTESPEGEQAISELRAGTSVVGITGTGLSKVIVPVPTKDIQYMFIRVAEQADKSKFAGFKSQFISQFGFPQDGDVKHPTSSIEALLEETISGEWGTDCADASGTRVIRTTNFTNDGVLNLDDVVLRSIDQKKVEKKQLHKGDIILEKSGGTKDNPVGRLVYFAEDGIYLANNFTQVLRPSNSVNSRYLFAALYYLYQTHKPLIKGLGNQTNGIQNLKVPQYLQLQVCVPDRKEQDAFEQVMQRADKSKYLN